MQDTPNYLSSAIVELGGGATPPVVDHTTMHWHSGTQEAISGARVNSLNGSDTAGGNGEVDRAQGGRCF